MDFSESYSTEFSLLSLNTSQLLFSNKNSYKLMYYEMSQSINSLFEVLNTSHESTVTVYQELYGNFLQFITDKYNGEIFSMMLKGSNVCVLMLYVFAFVLIL